MKKNKYITLLLTCILFCSCSAEEKIYSCDLEIDKWTKENLESISTMRRNELLMYKDNYSLQKSIYSAMSPEQKINIWEEKILEILELPWTEKEKKHIQSLLNIIQTHYAFSNSDYYSKYRDEIDLVSYKWIKYANEELNWGEDKIYATGMTINSTSMINGNLIVDESYDQYSNHIKTRSESNLDCACHASSGITKGACASGYTCKTGNCRNVYNCGLLFASECVGLCVRK